MFDGDLTNDVPVWWPYPASCERGHPWGPGKVAVAFRPCPCAGGEPGTGHTVVACRADGCESAWCRPAHDPDRAAGLSQPTSQQHRKAG